MVLSRNMYRKSQKTTGSAATLTVWQWTVQADIEAILILISRVQFHRYIIKRVSTIHIVIGQFAL